MRVNLAAQVLSETIDNLLNNVRSKEAEVSGQFGIMINMFFDCLNVRSTKEHIIKRKPFRGKSLLKHKMILITQKMLRLK